MAVVTLPSAAPEARTLRATDALFWPTEHAADARTTGYAAESPNVNGGGAWFGPDPRNDVVSFFMANVIVGASGKAAAELQWRTRAPSALRMITEHADRMDQVTRWNAWLTNFNTTTQARFGAGAPKFALFKPDGTGLVGGSAAPDAAIQAILDRLQYQAGQGLRDFRDSVADFADMLPLGSLEATALEGVSKQLNNPSTLSKVGTPIKRLRVNAQLMRRFFVDVRTDMEQFDEDYPTYKTQTKPLFEKLEALIDYKG